MTGLVKAADTFDQARDVPFQNWASMLIKQHLINYSRVQWKHTEGMRQLLSEALAITRSFPGYNSGNGNGVHDDDRDDSLIIAKKVLSPREFTLIKRRFVDDMSLSQLVKADGNRITKEGIRRRLNIILKKLRPYFDD